jgi:hypothetical protein
MIRMLKRRDRKFKIEAMRPESPAGKTRRVCRFAPERRNVLGASASWPHDPQAVADL